MQSISIGLTPQSPCSYLKDQMERVAIAVEPQLHTPENYEMLLANGFRRSGKTIYRPYCDHCSACQSIRIPVAQFSPSRSQKRLWSKRDSLTWELKSTMDEGWYALYSRYIIARHQDGSMFPPNKNEFLEFSRNKWLDSKFLHVYQGETLLAIAVTDITPNAFSAFYTFFDPNSPLSLGSLCVLLQIQLCHQTNREWLYLGYQIDSCPAMNYKVRFQPHQKLVNQRWQG